MPSCSQPNSSTQREVFPGLAGQSGIVSSTTARDHSSGSAERGHAVGSTFDGHVSRAGLLETAGVAVAGVAIGTRPAAGKSVAPFRSAVRPADSPPTEGYNFIAVGIGGTQASPLGLGLDVHSGGNFVYGVQSSGSQVGVYGEARGQDSKGNYVLLNTVGVGGVSCAGTGVAGYSYTDVSQQVLGVGMGVSGTSGTGNGVLGTSNSGYGINGSSTTASGVHGFSTSSDGVFGESGDSLHSGVYDNSAGFGVTGRSDSGTAMQGITAGSGDGVYGGAGGAGYGVHGKHAASNPGVFGVSVTGAGIFGQGAPGVSGSSATGDGVYGIATVAYSAGGGSALPGRPRAGTGEGTGVFGRESCRLRRARQG